MKILSKYSVLITCLISSVLVVLALWVFDTFYTQISIENTGDIRNIGLLLFALAGIPFLILGHITRRSDLKEKQNDLALKTDTILFNSLIKSAIENRDRLNAVFQSIEAKTFDLDLDDPTADRSYDDQYVLNDYLSDFEPLSDKPRRVSSLKKALSNWGEFSSISLTISNIMNAAYEVNSDSLRRMIFSSIAANIDENNLKVLYIIALAFDDSNEMLNHGESQGITYYFSFLSGDFGEFLSDHFIDQIELIHDRYAPE